MNFLPARADNQGATVDGEFPVIESPGWIDPTASLGPALPPREDMPGVPVSVSPTPSAPITDWSTPSETPSETPLFNPSLDPMAPAVNGFLETQGPGVGNSVDRAPSSTTSSTLKTSPSPSASPSDVGKQPVAVADVPERPATMAATSIKVPMKAGSTEVTSAAKAVLVTAVSLVKSNSNPVSIPVSTVGTSIAKATAQAASLVKELRRLGVAAITVLTRVGSKTTVSVVISKKPKP